MNKLLERLVTMTMTQIFMISIAVGGVYYWLVYDDGALMDTTIVSLTTEKNTQETKRKDTDATLKEEKRIKALVGTLGTQFQEIAKRLPNQLSMIDMTRQIQIFSQNARVKIKNNTPLLPKKMEIVDEVPVKIVIDDASFGDIALFIYQASISERLVRIRDFTISPSTTRLRFEGTVIGYRLNADDPKKEPPKK